MRVFRNPQVNFYVDEVEATLQFYVDAFGFEETFRTPAEGKIDHAELRLDGFILGLATNAAARDHHGLTTGGGNPSAEVCIWTEDVDQTYAKLLEHGAESLSAPHDFLNGRLRAAWVADPAGNPVQIVTKQQ